MDMSTIASCGKDLTGMCIFFESKRQKQPGCATFITKMMMVEQSEMSGNFYILHLISSKSPRRSCTTVTLASVRRRNSCRGSDEVSRLLETVLFF